MNTEALIERYLSDTVDETDLQRIITQLEENPTFREQFVESVGMAGLVATTISDTAPNEEAIMCGIGAGQCALADVEAVMASLETDPTTPKRMRPSTWLPALIAAAAILIVAFVLNNSNDGTNPTTNIADSANPPPPELLSDVDGTDIQYDSVPPGIPEMQIGDAPPWAPTGPIDLKKFDGPSLLLANAHLRRELRFDGHAWRTVSLDRPDHSGVVNLYSDEFRILLMDGTTLTVSDYQTSAEVKLDNTKDGQLLELIYIPRHATAAEAPAEIRITYTLPNDKPWTYKTIELQFSKNGAIDRLDVERFVSTAETHRGGRGEPTFLNNAWYLGLEFPAGHTRHPTFQPRPYAHIGNHSYIDLEGYDREENPPAGLVAAFHFPGQTASGAIHSKRAVLGVAQLHQPLELAFREYLKEIKRPSRTFLHYNNWYDNSGKNLSPDTFADVTAKAFQDNLAPYGVSLDAMVPDNGWQDSRSISNPIPSRWPKGLSGLADRLETHGTSLGLWIAANNYNADVNWAKKQGYPEAIRNERFTQFKRYQCIVDRTYQREMRNSIRHLITEGRLSYIKHDFNNMCCSGKGHGHLPTDRHGHEASVDAMIQLLAYERELNPKIYQNLTNWTWFSPWWLQHADSIWMLAADSAIATNWPQLSKRDMAITYRDSHLHRIWGDASTRPLVPISSLMTHGIIFADRNRMGDQDETLREWSDYVMAYYGRGVQLHELYITPKMMTPERWKVLGHATNWAKKNAATLENAVYVGGDPARGETNGYVAWNGDRGILTARNPHLHPQVLEVPIDTTTWYTGPENQIMHARVLYPHQGVLAQTFASGNTLRITIPGHTLMTMELLPGPAASEERTPATITKTEIPNGTIITIPDRVYSRLDFLSTSSGKKNHSIRINGTPAKTVRTQTGKGWSLHTFDLRPHIGQSVTISWHSHADTPFSRNRLLDAWILADQQVTNQTAVPMDRPFPIADGFRRKTQLLMESGRRTDALVYQADLDAPVAAKLHISLFGVNPGKKYEGHSILLNGTAITTLSPTNGDQWESRIHDLPASIISDGLQATNIIEITNPGDDMFKVANLQLALKTADGRWILSSRTKTVHVSSSDWAYAEGIPFANKKSQPVELRFNKK